MEFTVSTSPSPKILLKRYDAASFPKFGIIFNEQNNKTPLRLLSQRPDEAENAVVMENRADKDVTALSYQWVITAEDGKVRRHTVSSDSYMVDVYDPVLRAGDRKLVCRNIILDESVLDHVLDGGGMMRAGSVTGPDPLVGVLSLQFEVDMLLFADGEIAGPDTEKFAVELQSRKPAAEFVAKQIRLALAEGRDVSPVLSALTEIPCFGRLGHVKGDPLVHWTRRYAREYLHAAGRKIGDLDMQAAKLRHFESRPSLPRFYRAEPGTH